MRKGIRASKHLLRALGGVGVLLAAALAPAASSAVTIELGGEVYKDKCSPCHADISQTQDFAVTFTHGNHISWACSSCHTEFPHRPEGVLRPTMKDCFNCHGLKHGGQGEMASGECYDCHKLGPVKLRPKFHTSDWAQTPHVAPAQAQANTLCAMCHTKAQCDDCHLKTGVQWTPATPFAYDVKNGCQACHGNANLTKTVAGTVKSYQVKGLDASAHRDITCAQCHTDFTYVEDAPKRTNLWYVNAGLACAECHDHEEAAAQYATSIHAEEIAAGNYRSATCGSCHGGHDIARLDTDQARKEMHLSGKKTCAGCHPEYWGSYSDYYHGAAYKAGAADAPACWDCHGSHTIQPANDASSTVAPANLVTTCASCHDQHGTADEDFVEDAAAMIHSKAAVREANPLAGVIDAIFGGSQ
ncbi:MAG: hypothetical protein ABFC80_05095 [Coriobacteriales bacterium]